MTSGQKDDEETTEKNLFGQIELYLLLRKPTPY